MSEIIITKATFHRFKQYRDMEINLNPGVSLLAGGNNSGKTSILQGLAIWEFCRTVLEIERGKKSLCIGPQRQGVGIGDDNFTPINVPSLKHLWTNLRTQKEKEPDGYTLWLRIDWTYQKVDRYLRIGLSLANDRLFIKVLDTNVQIDEPIPRFAYVPPFAGIVSKEPRHTKAAIRAYIGQGLAGAVLRNIIFDLYRVNEKKRAEEKVTVGGTRLSEAFLKKLREEDPYGRLQFLLQKVFSCGLRIKDYNELYHTSISIDEYRGEIRKGRFQRIENYTPRDLMVEGSGFLQWLTVLALALDPDINLVLLDEPDAHLHPSLQEVLLSELNKLAGQVGKQVLYSTHSPELIKHQQHDRIIDTNDTHPKYLNTREQKVALLAGIGAKYTPRLVDVEIKKKILFVEDESDYKIISNWATKIGKPFPKSFVFWPLASGHKERKYLFIEMKKLWPGLVAMSLVDRDLEPVNTVNNDLIDKSYSHSKDGFFARKWRRRHIESYLLHPDAIARTANIFPEMVIHHILEHFALDISGRFTAQNEPEPFLQADAKSIISENQHSVQKQFGVSKYAITNEMRDNEIPEDARKIIENIHSLLGN